jgi:hypothetical protein
LVGVPAHYRKAVFDGERKSIGVEPAVRGSRDADETVDHGIGGDHRAEEGLDRLGAPDDLGSGRDVAPASADAY